jgi:hypothetical protein
MRHPQGGNLIFDAAGNLYGTASYGGAIPLAEEPSLS